MRLPVFMDYHSTTPVDPRVLERMLPYFCADFGNASSRSHAYGWKAEEAVEVARGHVAELLHASPTEIVFTSGATESNNLALMGVAEAYESKGKHIITQVTEHKAVLDVCAALERKGFRITYLPVDSVGRVDVADVERAISSETILCSIMHINNEIGTVQPLHEIGAVCRKAGVLLHSDMAQSAAVASLDVEAPHCDLVSLSAHKFYGPKGVGALYVRRRNPRVTLLPRVFGGGHERGMRSGTLNVPGIVGMGEAARLAQVEGGESIERIGRLRDRLQAQIFSGLREDQVLLNGPHDDRHPGNLNVAFRDIEGEILMLSMQEVAVSSGSACTSATMQPSHVLKAIGRSSELSHSSLRFGLGRYTTEDEVEFVGQLVCERVQKLRKQASR